MPPERAKVILVTGATSTGKTTLTHALCPALNATNPKAGPVANPVGQDWFFNYASFSNDTCEMITCGDHTWRNWEASSAVDWKGLVAAVKAAVNDGKQKYVIVEGFLLLENQELVNMASAIIRVELETSEIWNRRLKRAQALKGLPEGMGENTNYEVLPVYASRENLPGCKAAVERASRRLEKYGEHAWLRLYFDEVVLPAIEKQTKIPPRGKPELVLNGSSPPGEDAWVKWATKQSVHFLLEGLTAHENSLETDSKQPDPSGAAASPSTGSSSDKKVKNSSVCCIL